jgi:F-type H+-transporting ATPase subunit delta
MFRVLEGKCVIAPAAGCAWKTPMLGNPAFRAGRAAVPSSNPESSRIPELRAAFGPGGAAEFKRLHEVAGVAEEDTIVSGVSGRYASALFSLAQDDRQTEAVANALARFDTLIAESPDLERLVRSPVFSAADQLKALNAVLAQADIGGIAANFIRLVASKRRLFFIREMIADYRKLYDASRGVTRAEVTSATALTDANVASLKDSLRAASGGREVDLDMKVDPSIIGGLIVKLGSRMIDGSLKTKLNAIRLAMKEVG